MPRYLLVLFIASICFPAMADTLKLRPAVNASGDVVVFSDFFDGTGEAGSTALFRAPRPGQHGTVRTSRLVAAVQQLGYRWIPPAGLGSIRVSRKMSTVEVDEIAWLIRREIAGAIVETDDPEDIDVVLPANLSSIRVADTRDAGATINQIEVTPRARRFRALMAFGEGSSQARRAVEGRYSVKQRIPVLNKPIGRDEIIAEDDIGWMRLDNRAVGNAIQDSAEMIGKAARRNLPEGQTVRIADLEDPRIVERNQLVTVVYRIPGMTLTSRGRALDDAANGEALTVLNLASSRTIEATAIGPGRVSVSDSADRIRVATNQ